MSNASSLSFPLDLVEVVVVELDSPPRAIGLYIVKGATPPY
jgi:hypothetical protein